MVRIHVCLYLYLYTYKPCFIACRRTRVTGTLPPHACDRGHQKVCLPITDKVGKCTSIPKKLCTYR